MYTFEELKSIFIDYLNSQKIVEKPFGLYEPVDYLMNMKGKRIRPVVCLMTANIFSSNISQALPIAYSIEMFHNFTLMHDDIMDDADIRRGNETVHVKYSENTGILSGDLMMILSYNHLITSCEELELKDKILKLFTSTAIKVCEGQQYDMDFETSDNVSIDEYLTMIKLKTAVLLAASMKAGAIVGGASFDDSQHLYDFGLNVGLAFQIQDDLLDTYGDVNVFGKKIGGDIVQNKKTYLYIKALELANDSDRKELKSLYNSNDIAPQIKIEKVRAIFDKLDVKGVAKELINDFSKKASYHFDSLSIPKSKLQHIKKLSDDLLKRNF